MCGIVGYIGKKDSVQILINGLKKLEYRGYDSAGIAVMDEAGVKVVKCKGRLSQLEQKLLGERISGSVGIGHTRWATHGEPNDINSHPHISQSGRIAVVHNGIIENYLDLKRFLAAKGYVFLSDTDTEIIAHLVEYHYRGDLVGAVIETLNELEGSYALGVLCGDRPDMFVAARKDSPLIAGIGDGGNFIASDIPAILEHTRDVYILEDKEIVSLTCDKINIYDIHGMVISKKVYHVAWDVDAAEKDGYEHFMIKEICEEPKVLRDTINARIPGDKIVFDDMKISADYLKKIKKIFIVACGTAYHAGVVGKFAIERLARLPVEVELASEFRYRDPLVDSSTLVIIISQSGETLDSLFALREAKKRGARILSIVNVVGSSIARESDDVLYTRAGPEIAVASTKAYNTQLAVLYLFAVMLALELKQIDDAKAIDLAHKLKKIPDAIGSILSGRERIQRFASQHYNAHSIFFIGRGLDYALAMEGSLKLKEISYIHSEAYAGGELKHGTIALIEKGTLVICSMTQDFLADKMINNIKEVKARGAVVLAIARQSDRNIDDIADKVIPIPDIEPLLSPIAAVTPMQLFAYYVAVQKGCDVDKPRNLAKSVTVE